MFGIVSNIVVGILRSLYGITAALVGGAATSVVNFTVASTSATWNYIAGGLTWVSIVTDGATGILQVPQNSAELRLGANANASGLRRVTSSVAGGVLAGGGAGGWLQNTGGEVRRAATQTVTDSTTFVADDTLTITLIAGRKYRFYLWYAFTVVNTSGVKIDLNGGTATMTSINGMIYLMSSAGAISNFAQITALTSSAALTATGTLHFGMAEGCLVCNAAGTLVPRFAQNAETGAAESVVAQINSYLTLADVP